MMNCWDNKKMLMPYQKAPWLYRHTEFCNPKVTPPGSHKCFITTCGVLWILSQWINTPSRERRCFAHTSAYTNGQNYSSLGRDQMNGGKCQQGKFKQKAKGKLSCLFFCVFVSADFIVLLSNPLKALFTTHPKSSAADFISCVSKPGKNCLWQLEVMHDFSGISVSASNLWVWQAVSRCLVPRWR